MAGSPIVKKFLEGVWETHQVKNSDYASADSLGEKGDVFSNFRMSTALGVDPLSGILVRMSDKWSRICNIHAKGGKNAVPNEGLADAFLDMAGYAAIAFAMYSEQHPEILERFDGSESFEDKL